MGSTAGILFFRTFSEIRPGIFTTRGRLRQSDTLWAFLMGPFQLRIRVPGSPAPLYPRYSGPEVAVGGADAMKSCPHCSASLEEDAVRCRRCGKWVVGERDQRRPNKKAGRTRKRLLILGAMVLLAWALWGIPESTALPNTGKLLREPRRSRVHSIRRSEPLPHRHPHGLVRLRDSRGASARGRLRGVWGIGQPAPITHQSR